MSETEMLKLWKLIKHILWCIKWAYKHCYVQLLISPHLWFMKRSNQLLAEKEAFYANLLRLVRLTDHCRMTRLALKILYIKINKFIYLQQKLTELRQWSEKVRNFDHSFHTANGLFYVDCSHIHDHLLPRYVDWLLI